MAVFPLKRHFSNPCFAIRMVACLAPKNLSLTADFWTPESATSESRIFSQVSMASLLSKSQIMKYSQVTHSFASSLGEAPSEYHITSKLFQADLAGLAGTGALIRR